ncbi:hypothetical protein SAMN02910317_02819 [Ruminococcaceae bacterium FB2012]|nr:hypothetical protein SAMN02910317_02819 [Ruminococcaceae bacterium FB2012]
MNKFTVNYLHSEELLSLVLAEETLIVLRADNAESRFRELA